jgi:hypothetical protein
MLYPRVDRSGPLRQRAWPTAVSIIAGYFVVLLSACNSSGGIDNRGNYAIDTYFPNANAAQQAENRARTFWQTHGAKFGPNPPYLAVQSNKLLPGEIVNNLYAKLINSPTTSSAFRDVDQVSLNPDIFSVLIFDTRSNRLVSNQGYAVVDLPARGIVAQFGSFTARYIGTGR